jgi:hypothetical protein
MELRALVTSILGPQVVNTAEIEEYLNYLLSPDHSNTSNNISNIS